MDPMTIGLGLQGANMLFGVLDADRKAENERRAAQVNAEATRLSPWLQLSNTTSGKAAQDIAGASNQMAPLMGGVNSAWAQMQNIDSAKRAEERQAKQDALMEKYYSNKASLPAQPAPQNQMQLGPLTKAWGQLGGRMS